VQLSSHASIKSLTSMAFSAFYFQAMIKAIIPKFDKNVTFLYQYLLDTSSKAGGIGIVVGSYTSLTLRDLFTRAICLHPETTGASRAQTTLLPVPVFTL
jgi:hypothetical protein